MKIAAMIARILLGLIFVFFGSNGFLHFLPMPPLPDNDAGHFAGVLIHSHYTIVVAALQVIGGALMLIGRYVPLGLILLGPVIVNILLYHALMDPKGIGPGLLTALLWLIVAYERRENLAGLFAK
jgi:putative oxidoreductase